MIHHLLWCVPLLMGGAWSSGCVVAPLDGDRLVATLLDHVVGEALEELRVLALVHRAEHPGGGPASWVHWKINKYISYIADLFNL